MTTAPAILYSQHRPQHRQDTTIQGAALTPGAVRNNEFSADPRMGGLGVSVIKGTGQRLKVSLLFPDFTVTARGSPLGVIWFLSPPLQVGPHGGRHAARPWQATALRVCEGGPQPRLPPPHEGPRQTLQPQVPRPPDGPPVPLWPHSLSKSPIHPGHTQRPLTSPTFSSSYHHPRPQPLPQTRACASQMPPACHLLPAIPGLGR